MRRALILVAVMSLVFTSACGADGFDPEGFQDMVDVLEQMEDDSSNPGDDSSNPDSPAANTSSPNRPPRPPGGITEKSEHLERFGRSEEELVYAPDVESYEDLVDYYDDHFGEEGLTATTTGRDGGRYERTAWNSRGVRVSVVDEGRSSRVTTVYDD